MASIKLNETKDGRRFFQISVSRGYGKAPYKTRWYWPDGWSKRTAEREAAKQAAAFELACKNGEVLNRAQEREKAAQEAAEAAKLKTVRQYADGVFMPTKEATFSENARSSYRMFLDKHILPVLGGCAAGGSLPGHDLKAADRFPAGRICPCHNGKAIQYSERHF